MPVRRWLCTRTGPTGLPDPASTIRAWRSATTWTVSLPSGLATGPVILFEGDDYIGTPVNLAARLCDVAQPREVLAVPQLAPYTPPWAVAGEAHAVPIAGFPGPVDVVSLARRGAPNGSGPRATEAHPEPDIA